MADYLLEIGCEEIPARMLAAGAAELLAALAARLEKEGLAPGGAGESFAGPRRLAVRLGGIPARQPDTSERIVGPPADKAFDAEGKPSRTALGFAQKLGVAPEKLERVETPKGLCLAGTRHTAGEPAAAVLARIVPEVVLKQSFPKTMRWGRGEHRYVRAIRNVVSLLDDTVVDLELAGVKAGRMSFGHRFLGARAVDIVHARHYEAILLGEHVQASAHTREAALAGALAELAAREGGVLEEDRALLEEVTYFVEEPHVVAGHFDEAYLELPQEVLVTSLRHHQKAFPVWRDREKRRLAPAFLGVANVPDVEGHIARGFERVLNARLADARFFWHEDRKAALATRLERLERVTFHEKLGSYAAKSRRLETLAPLAARLLELGGDAEAVARAAAGLCKADLTTGMVGEFAELQGVMGGLYLASEGQGGDLARAVYEHYLPLSLDGPLPASPGGQALSLADKLDTLVGCFGVGLVPTGTRDPFGLRRAAQGVVRILLAAGTAIDLAPLLVAAAEAHAGHPGAPGAARALPALEAYLVERIEFVLRGEGHRTDTLRAVLAVAPLRVADAARRARALSSCRQQPRFEETFTVLKRVANIAGRSGATDYDPARLVEPAERELDVELRRVQQAAAEQLAGGSYEPALDQISTLNAPLGRFFAEVRVMDADPALSENRQRLCRAIGALVASIADFQSLQVEQGKDQE